MNTFLLAYVATDVTLSLVAAILIYRKRKMLVHILRRFIFDATGTAAVLSNMTTLKTMVEVLIPTPKKTDAYDESTLEFQRDDAEDRLQEARRNDQMSRYNAACKKARKDHKKLPKYTDFSQDL
jgi:hypothetical protein